MKGTLIGSPNPSDIPLDTYIWEVIDIVEQRTKNDDPLIRMAFRIVDGPYAGKKAFNSLTLAASKESPAYKVSWIAKAFLKAIGEPHKGDSFEWDSDGWISKKFKAKYALNFREEPGKTNRPTIQLASAQALETGNDPIFGKDSLENLF